MFFYRRLFKLYIISLMIYYHWIYSYSSNHHRPSNFLPYLPPAVSNLIDPTTHTHRKALPTYTRRSLQFTAGVVYLGRIARPRISEALELYSFHCAWHSPRRNNKFARDRERARPFSIRSGESIYEARSIQRDFFFFFF